MKLKDSIGNQKLQGVKDFSQTPENQALRSELKRVGRVISKQIVEATEATWRSLLYCFGLRFIRLLNQVQQYILAVLAVTTQIVQPPEQAADAVEEVEEEDS